MAMPARRRYDSTRRGEAAETARLHVLDVARSLFSRRGIDKVTISQIAEKAGVSAPTIYARFKSKDGILQAIMSASLFGRRFEEAQSLMDNVTDGPELVSLTAKVARAIYESENNELGLMRGASAFSPSLRKMELQFERIRFEMQEARLRLLAEQDKLRAGLDLEAARRIMWMYTSRDVYRMLVIDGRWTAEAYEAWLARTLRETLVKAEN